jgi:hypothetical protein
LLFSEENIDLDNRIADLKEARNSLKGIVEFL